MNVRLDIGSLVIDGIDLGAQDRVHLQMAAETELTRLLGERGLASDLARGIAVPSLRGSDMIFAPGATPSAIGVAIARSVAGGVAK